MSQVTASEKKRRFVMFSVVGLIAALILLFVSFAFFSPQKSETPTSLKAGKTDAVKGGAGGEGTPEYNTKLQKHDDQKASEALKAGDSFFPTPTKDRKLLSRKEDTPPPPQPTPAPVRVTPTRPPRTDNTLLKRMMEDLATLDTKLSTVSAGAGAIFWQHDFSRDNRKETSQKPAAEVTPRTASPLKLNVGDLLYAIVDTGVNSDVPSPVMATVSAGKYNKTKLIGKFQRFDERMLLTFNRAVLPSGENVQLEAYAVDPDTTEASVASSVDTHFFSRWGGLIASAFLEGLSEAKRFSGASSTVYGGYGAAGGYASDRMVWNNYSPEDQAWIAAGKVGEKSSKIFERGFDRPPTVYLKAGSSIGVLIMNVKETTQR